MPRLKVAYSNRVSPKCSRNRCRLFCIFSISRGIKLLQLSQEQAKEIRKCISFQSGSIQRVHNRNPFLYLCSKIRLLENKPVITLLFLFSFGLLQAHAIIPHHHPGDTCLSEPDAHHTTDPAGKSGPIPWHCHPFNQVILIKQHFAWKINAVQHFQSFQAIVTFGGIRIMIMPTLLTIRPPCIAILQHSFRPYTSYRAPPALS